LTCFCMCVWVHASVFLFFFFIFLSVPRVRLYNNDNNNNNNKPVYLHPLQAFSGLYTNPKCIFVRGSAPTQPGSSYYYLLTRPEPERLLISTLHARQEPWGRGPHRLLTGVLMSNVLTKNFGRMSFGGPFPAGGPYARA